MCVSGRDSSRLRGAGKMPLPEHTYRNARAWDFRKRDPLPEELQLTSRPRSKVRRS